MKLKETLKKVGKTLKEKEENFYKKLTTPLSEKEKKLLKLIEEFENDELFSFDFDIEKSKQNINQEKIFACRHEFIVKDFKRKLLKCKHCGLEITAKDLGRVYGVRVLAEIDLNDIFSL